MKRAGAHKNEANKAATSPSLDLRLKWLRLTLSNNHTQTENPPTETKTATTIWIAIWFPSRMYEYTPNPTSMEKRWILVRTNPCNIHEQIETSPTLQAGLIRLIHLNFIFSYRHFQHVRFRTPRADSTQRSDLLRAEDFSSTTSSS
jgi:hypothetical protein